MTDTEFDTYDSALNTVASLNPAPQILAQASNMLRDPNVDVEDIVALVRADASLTTEIIRISNSAYYGFETKSNSLSDSIGRIGFDEITRMIGMCICKNLFAKSLTHYDISAELYWAQSMSVAVIVEQLARLHGENAEEAYTVGLLHTVGRLIINQIMDDFEIDATWDWVHPLEEWERETIGFTYAYAGAMLLKRWDFASKITHPIFYQLHEPKAEHGWSLHANLHFAICMVDLCGTGFEQENFDIDSLQHILEIVSLEEEDARLLFRTCRDQYGLIKRTIGI